MRRFLVPLLAASVFVLTTAVPSEAAVGISIVNMTTGFSPQVARGPIGTTFRWTNDDSIDHTSTNTGGLGLWDSGHILPGASFAFTLRFAGVFSYHCSIHTTMTGRIKVPIQVSPSTGTTETTFTVTVASVRAPSGYVYDVQRRKGSRAWRTWRSGIGRRSLSFRPRSTGRFSFRSRLRRTSNGATSGWSSSRSVRVS